MFSSQSREVWIVKPGELKLVWCPLGLFPPITMPGIEGVVGAHQAMGTQDTRDS